MCLIWETAVAAAFQINWIKNTYIIIGIYYIINVNYMPSQRECSIQVYTVYHDAVD